MTVDHKLSSTPRGKLQFLAMWGSNTAIFFLKAIKSLLFPQWHLLQIFFRSCCCSVTKSRLTLCDPMDYRMPGLPVLHSFPEFAQTPDPLNQWCHPAISSSVTSFSSFPQSFPASFSYQSALCIRWPKYWSFDFSIGPSNEYSGLISFRIDWFDLLAVQGRWSCFLDVHSVVWHPFTVISYIPQVAIFLLGVMTVVPVGDIRCLVRTGLINRLLQVYLTGIFITSYFTRKIKDESLTFPF